MDFSFFLTEIFDRRKRVTGNMFPGKRQFTGRCDLSANIFIYNLLGCLYDSAKDNCEYKNRLPFAEI